MADNKNTDFRLKQDSYAAFDALSLKELIQNRLNEDGVYTDQTFEGSNMSSIIDVIAYSYHLLLFYLNQTSAETMFTDTNIYENMNRIVKIIDYKPKGYQSSLLSFEATATTNLTPNTYTIPRYSFLNADGNVYSFINDATFNKSSAGSEILNDFSKDNLLRQGRYFEYPASLALGEEFEIITLSLKDPISKESLKIDSDSIDVYVRDADTQIVHQYTKTNNIFLEAPGTRKYELRLNESELYEIKFGNGVFSNKLNVNDTILIYYIQSDGISGKVSAGTVDGSAVNFYNTPQFNIIKNFIYDENFNLLTTENSQFINFANNVDSTDPVEKESVENIRINAAKNFQLQNRLVTKQDFENFLNINYSTILKTYSVVNNREYVKKYLQYFYDIGLNQPNNDSRLLFNQVNFSTINQDNNVYMFLVPKLRNVDSQNRLSFINKSQKSSIVNSMQDKKLFNCNIVPMDPVYTAFTLGLQGPGAEVITTSISEETSLVLKRNVLSNLSETNVKDRVNNIFRNYFNVAKMGQVVSLDELKAQILKLDGIEGLETRRVTGGNTYSSPNISLLIYNPIYPDKDVTIINEDIQLPFFKYPYLQDKSILNNIVVENV